MDEEDIMCEGFYGEDIFDDVELAHSEEEFDLDEAVDRLYVAIYGKD